MANFWLFVYCAHDQGLRNSTCVWIAALHRIFSRALELSTNIVTTAIFRSVQTIFVACLESVKVVYGAVLIYVDRWLPQLRWVSIKVASQQVQRPADTLQSCCWVRSTELLLHVIQRGIAVSAFLNIVTYVLHGKDTLICHGSRCSSLHLCNDLIKLSWRMDRGVCTRSCKDLSIITNSHFAFRIIVGRSTTVSTNLQRGRL